MGAPANGSWVSTRGVVTQRGLVVSHQVAAFARVRGLVCDGGRGWAFAACRPARDFRHRNTCALPAPSPLSPHCSGGKVGPFHGDKVGNPARRFCNVGAAGRTCAKSRPPTITGGREQGHTQLLLMTRMRLKMARESLLPSTRVQAPQHVCPARTPFVRSPGAPLRQRRQSSVSCQGCERTRSL